MAAGIAGVPILGPAARGVVQDLGAVMRERDRRGKIVPLGAEEDRTTGKRDVDRSGAVAENGPALDCPARSGPFPARDRPWSEFRRRASLGFRSIRVFTRPRLQSYWAEARNPPAIDSDVPAAGANEIFDGPAGVLAQGIGLLVGTPAGENENIKTCETIGLGLHVFRGTRSSRVHGGMSSRIRNKGSGLVAAGALLVEDADVSGRTGAADFRERFHQITRRKLRGLPGDAPAAEAWSCDSAAAPGIRPADAEEAGTRRTAGRAPGRGDESGRLSWCHDQYDARSGDHANQRDARMIAGRPAAADTCSSGFNATLVHGDVLRSVQY